MKENNNYINNNPIDELMKEHGITYMEAREMVTGRPVPEFTLINHTK